MSMTFKILEVIDGIMNEPLFASVKVFPKFLCPNSFIRTILSLNKLVMRV